MGAEAGVSLAALATAGIVGYYIYTLTDKDPQKKPTPPPRSRGDRGTVNEIDQAADELRIKEQHAAMWEEEQHQQRLQRQKEEHAAWQKRQQAEAAAAKRKAAADAAAAAAAEALRVAEMETIKGVSFDVDLTGHFTEAQIAQIKDDLHSFDWKFKYQMDGWAPFRASKDVSQWQVANGTLTIGITKSDYRTLDGNWWHDSSDSSLKTGINFHSGRYGYVAITGINREFQLELGAEGSIVSTTIYNRIATLQGMVYNHAYTPKVSTWYKNDTQIVYKY
tara:strand:+ start:980 stop:1813 length:834 start_codon:yes stop_codon:yes gene_type:complete